MLMRYTSSTRQWFKRLLRLAIEANFYGHSLIELGNLTNDGDGCLSYDGVLQHELAYSTAEDYKRVLDVAMAFLPMNMVIASSILKFVSMQKKEEKSLWHDSKRQ